MLVLLLCCSLSSFAADGGKPVSLDEAIHIALENHPRLKMATAEISRARATRGEIWDGGSTSFSYSWGQLNGEYRNDHELSVEQPLGSLLTPFIRMHWSIRRWKEEKPTGTWSRKKSWPK